MDALVVIAGMSGAGRTQAAKNLEDLGWMVIDNTPPPLMFEIVKGTRNLGEGLGAPAAVVIGTGRHPADFEALARDLRERFDGLTVLFMDASTDTLVRRYESTRRPHPSIDMGRTESAGVPASPHAPQGPKGLAESIEVERALLAPLKQAADVVIDTTDLNVHQLRLRMMDLFGRDGSRSAMVTSVMSFSYAQGVPRDADIVIDCRFLPNPHWVESLRPLSGLDYAVSGYLKAQAVTVDFLSHLEGMLEFLMPHFVTEGKSFLTLAFGCTGGRHRSVAVAEHVTNLLNSWGYEPSVTHRDLNPH